jgi:hypothetical protein
MEELPPPAGSDLAQITVINATELSENESQLGVPGTVCRATGHGSEGFGCGSSSRARPATAMPTAVTKKCPSAWTTHRPPFTA